MYHQVRWTLEKIKARMQLIAPKAYLRSVTLPAFRYQMLESPLAPPPVSEDVDDAAWMEIGAYQYWGLWMTDFALRTRFQTPQDWDASLPCALFLPLGEAGDFSHPEALAYIDGAPYAACDRHHQEILLDPQWVDGKPHLLALHGWSGLGGAVSGEYFTRLFMRPCLLTQIHQPTRDFLALARVAWETASRLEEGSPARHALLNALNNAFLLLDTREPLEDGFYESLPAAFDALRKGIQAGDAPMDVHVHATGHAHIDVAWLWTVGQTRRKAERTFFNVIRYMEQFPHYHFSQSQPQLYEFIRHDQPQLFESIRQRVAQGRWEPMGGMWVEADCNLSGAESLARQFLLGRSYFRQHFGKEAETPVLWLPDVFGYAWALPQLIKQAGLKYFMTIKIGWSQYNRLPYDTFLWQGIDGTQILTHFSTVKEMGSPYASTYNSMANPAETLGAWSNFQQKEMQRDLLMAYGYGDGGGGPTREMLENLEHMGHFPGLPQVRHSSVREFFERIAPLAESPQMPVWNGELYLEYHRGTYTTQARTKRANRKSEFLLHDAEFLAAWAAQVNPNYHYPSEDFTAAWRTVCLNQFHDIIPGSSITQVYEEALAQHARLAQEMAEIEHAALTALAEKCPGDLLVVNPTSFPRRELIWVEGGHLLRFWHAGRELDVQPAEGGAWVEIDEAAPYSLTPLQCSALELPLEVSQNNPAAGEAPALENDCLRVAFNAQGDIVSIFDKTCQREVLAPGAVANQFQAFEDRPKDYDAWDVDIYYDDKMWLAQPAESLRMLENGPLRWTLEVRRRILGSPYVQRISLRRGSARLDFDTQIEWNERHILLKAAFPVDILVPQATHEIQWGSVQRPTHRNTSWDWARFETCAHKWVDLSEGDYGVSLLNDCKYGHDIHGSVLRLTLLRSPTLPDPAADLGEHRFTYSLLPHAGGWETCTQAQAYALNDPLTVFRPSAPAASGESALPPLVRCDSPNVIIETVKGAEDGRGILLRLYESQRKRGRVTLQVGFDLQAAWITNLLEEDEVEAAVEGSRVALDLRPYQIVSLRLLKK